MRQFLLVLAVGALGGCSKAAVLPASSTPAPSPAPEFVEADCSRANAAEGNGVVKGTAAHYRIDRQPTKRTLTESFDFEGIAVVSVQGGCAHAGHIVSLQGKVPQKAGDLAALLARMPIDADSFVKALQHPEACGPTADGTEVVRCGDAVQIDVRRDGDTTTLTFDFAL